MVGKLFWSWPRLDREPTTRVDKSATQRHAKARKRAWVDVPDDALIINLLNCAAMYVHPMPPRPVPVGTIAMRLWRAWR